MKVDQKDIPVFESELLAYIDSETNAVNKRPDGFGITAREYADAHAPMGHMTSKRILEDLVAAGKLQKKEMKSKGHKSMVYFK